MKSHRDTVLWRQTQQTAYTTLKHRRRLFNNALGQNTSYDKENFFFPSFSIFCGAYPCRRHFYYRRYSQDLNIGQITRINGGGQTKVELITCPCACILQSTAAKSQHFRFLFFSSKTLIWLAKNDHMTFHGVTKLFSWFLRC